MKKILIIDDEHILLDTLEQIFKLNGYNPITAKDAKSAYKVLKTTLVDLIICDIGLPDISGQEILMQVKSNPQTKDIPVIMLSAYTDPGERATALSNQAAMYLTKPISNYTLLDIVGKMFV
jgi:CheY-like chemotaxis protein